MIPGNEAWDKFLGYNNSPVLAIRLTIFNDIIITKLRDAIVIRSLGHNERKSRITLLSLMNVGNGNRTKFLHAVLNRIEEIRIVKTILGLLHRKRHFWFKKRQTRKGISSMVLEAITMNKANIELGKNNKQPT
jgi:hypothetical protein